ncbi:MAG: FixH family protein [Actinomycetota bacterium]
MRKIWFLIGGVILLVAVVVALGFFYFGSSDGGSTGSEGCPPAPSTHSAGNAQINAQAIGKGFDRLIVIHVTDKKSGAPLHGAKVKVQGTMTCPHFMPLIEKNLREASNGTYKGDYNLFMPGQWALSIVVRSEQGEATTSSLPVRVKPGS